MPKVDLSAIRNLIQQAVDFDRLEIGRKRQDQICRGQSPDYAPLILGHCQTFVGDYKENRTFIMGDHFLAGGTPSPEIEDYPHFGLAHQLDSPEVMLYEGLWELLSWVRSGSDAQLSLRPRLAGIIPTCFGLKYNVTDDGTGWYSEPITLDQALDADLTDLQQFPYVRKTLDHINFFQDNLPDGVKVSLPIAVGPLNIADNLLGKSLWTEFYDHPDEMHRLFAKITDTIVTLLKLYKKVAGEPDDMALIGPLYMTCGGVKMGNDSMVMLSPQMFTDFVLPYVRRLCREFSGGYHHSCGHYPPHFQILCGLQELTLFNFGEPGLWDMPTVVGQMQQNGKIYYGGWERLPDEPIEDYLRRGVEICGPQRNRAILYAKGTGPWPEAAKTMDLWYRLQDEIYPR